MSKTKMPLKFLLFPFSFGLCVQTQSRFGGEAMLSLGAVRPVMVSLKPLLPSFFPQKAPLFSAISRRVSLLSSSAWRAHSFTSRASNPLHNVSVEPCYLSCCMPDRRLRVAVLLSGGVDSSVALRLLHAAGHQCTAFYLKIWFQVLSLSVFLLSLKF